MSLPVRPAALVSCGFLFVIQHAARKSARMSHLQRGGLSRITWKAFGMAVISSADQWPKVNMA
jgi:hypothetical protein